MGGREGVGEGSGRSGRVEEWWEWGRSGSNRGGKLGSGRITSNRGVITESGRVGSGKSRSGEGHLSTLGEWRLLLD